MHKIIKFPLVLLLRKQKVNNNFKKKKCIHLERNCDLTFSGLIITLASSVMCSEKLPKIKHKKNVECHITVVNMVVLLFLLLFLLTIGHVKTVAFGKLAAVLFLLLFVKTRNVLAFVVLIVGHFVANDLLYLHLLLGLVANFG